MSTFTYITLLVFSIYGENDIWLIFQYIYRAVSLGLRVCLNRIVFVCTRKNGQTVPKLLNVIFKYVLTRRTPRAGNVRPRSVTAHENLI